VPLSAVTGLSVMNGGSFPADLEPRKRALTLEHLLTMSSGLDCDDADPELTRKRDVVTQQTDEPDWLEGHARAQNDAGAREARLYCSVNPKLIGGVMRRAAGRPLPELFHALIAEPLASAALDDLTPTGTPSWGAACGFLPAGFMKLGS